MTLFKLKFVSLLEPKYLLTYLLLFFFAALALSEDHWRSIGYAWSGLRVKVLVAAVPAGVAARRLRRTPSGRTVASSCADERLLLGSAALKVALDPQVRAEGGLASHLTRGQWSGVWGIAWA